MGAFSGWWPLSRSLVSCSSCSLGTNGREWNVVAQEKGLLRRDSRNVVESITEFGAPGKQTCINACSNYYWQGCGCFSGFQNGHLYPGAARVVVSVKHHVGVHVGWKWLIWLDGLLRELLTLELSRKLVSRLSNFSWVSTVNKGIISDTGRHITSAQTTK